jgi:murein DD-endopeptidase MepM/ murein hydrolase activator NlpD
MVGTVLKGDLQSSIEDQLQQYARGIGSTASSAAGGAASAVQQIPQAVGDTWEDLQRAGRTGAQDVQAQLADYATQAYNASQEAQRQAQGEAQRRAEQAAQVEQELTAHANQALAGAQQQQPQAGAPAQAALPHTEEPGTATDVGASDLGKNWKTQFDFGATYTGDYRTGTPHRGVDLVPSSGKGIGTEVDAFTPGTVTNVSRASGAGGLMVYVQDADGLTHAYMHLAGSNVKVGDQVQRGQPIAQMGESGTEGSPHLHYEVRKNAAVGDPLNQLIDPRPYLNGTKQPGGGGPLQAAQQAVGGAVQGARDVIAGATQRTAEPLPQSAFEWKVNGGQSLNRDQVVQAGQQVGLSPDEAGYLYDSGVRNNVDAASALAIIKLEGNARNPNNNMFDISNAAYGGRAVPGSRWGQYDSKQQAIDAYYQLINKEYIPNGQDTIGTIMHGPGSGPSTSTSHAYAPISENRPSYPEEVLSQVKQWGGQVQEAVAGAAGAAQGAVGGAVAGARRATGDVIQAGEQAATAARAPIYGTLAGGRDQAVQQLNVLQSQIDSLRDQLAGAPQGARQAIAGAAEPLIAGAQQTAQDVAGSRAGDLVLRSGRTPQEEAGYRQRQLDEVNRLATEQRTAPPPEITPGSVLGGAARLAIENPPTAGPSLEEYRQRQTQVGQAIEQQNPLRDVPFVGGLTSQAAEFGASGQWLIPFGTVARTGEEVLAAAGVARPLLQRVGGEALSNALQNALYEVTTRTDATPQSVGEAFISGGALGGLMPLGAAGVTRIGQEILSRAPELTPLLRTRQRGEVDLGLITTGEPTPRPGEAPVARPPAGRQRLPNYDPNTPEGRFEAVARPLRESSPDGLLHLDLNTLPENVLPLDRNTPTSSATGLIRTNPGGAPHTDDLRALYEANTQKRDFYADQSDQGVPTVGPHNLEEWFALNAITSQQTNVTGQVSEAIKVMGMVRKIARDGRAEGLSSPEIKANILKAVNDYTWSGPSGTNKRIGANKGYATGVSETGGIKTPTFAGNYGSAESRLYDPGITNDIHNWRAMNVDSTQVPAIREGKQYLDTPHESTAANNKTLYRGTEAVFNELGAEQGVDGYAFQSAVWDGIRNMQDGAPAAWKKWQAGDFQGAIRDAQAAGVFNRAKGVTGAPEPGEISRAMNQPGVKSALAQWGPYLKDPLPPELGISSVSRVYPGEMSKGKAGGPKRGAETLRPASLAFRQGERALAESYAPVVGGLPSDALARLGVDERGVMPWLAASHRVVEQAPGDYVVHLPAGNADTARYVAATVGDALGAAEMPIHYPDYRAPDIAGFKLVADEATVRRAQQALADDGHASIRGPTGRSLQVPLHDPESAARIVTTLQRSGIDPATLSDYTGSNERISADAYPRYLAETRARFEPTTAERRGLLERARGLATEGGAAGPGAPGGRQRGQANVPLATNLGGAAFGGYAGNLATPSDATPEERARNIAAGAVAGFGGTHLITRGLGGRLAPEVAGRPTLEAQLAARPAEGFRAPGRPEGLELRATTQAPPGGPPTGGGASPELDRLNAMYGDKKAAPTGNLQQRLQSISNNVTRALTDRQVDINRAQERYAKNLGRPLRGDEMAAELQRLASDPVAQVKVDEGLKPAIQSVGADYPALRNYVTLRSNIEVADALAARTGKPEVGTDRLFSGGLNREQSVKALQDLEDQLGPARFERVKAAADQVTAFNHMLRQRLVDAQVLDPQVAAALDVQYPNWVKTRILDYMADPTGGQGAGTKLGLNDRGLREYTLTGTERAREDPIASTVAYAHQVERMAMKNEAFNAFLQIDQGGTSPMLRQVPQSYSPKANEVTMIGFVNGEKQKFVTDNQALGAAINGAGVMATPEWTSAWQKVFRSLATSRNPLFLAGNAALDIPTYVLRESVREGGPQALPRIMGELARGYGDAFQGLFQSEFRGAGTSAFLKGGGGQAGFFTGGEGMSKRAVAEMQRKNVFQIDGPQDLGRLTKDLLTLHPVEALGERIELGPRVAAMRLAERRGANPTQAIIDGRTVTVDFSQGGTVTKYLNNFIPFFNVGFQGPAQIARAFRDNPRAFVATVGTLIGIPSAAAEVWNNSDPQRAKDYGDVPQDVKNQGIVIMLPGDVPVDAKGNRKPMYAVIKLREWAPFAATAREATDRAMGTSTQSWQDAAKSIGSGLLPTNATSLAQLGTEPTTGIPVVPAAAQLAMNRDFFRNRDIVTQRADQSASTLAKSLTPIIQKATDAAGIPGEIRPSAIDFLIQNQGAGVGSAALAASNLAGGQENPNVGPTALPGVGGLIGRFAGNRTGQDLQDARDQAFSEQTRQILRTNGITTTIGPVGSTVGQIPLTQEEETRYQQLANQYVDDTVRRTAASEGFATRPQISRQGIMDAAVTGAKARAAAEVVKSIDVDERARRIKAATAAKVAA